MNRSGSVPEAGGVVREIPSLVMCAFAGLGRYAIPPLSCLFLEILALQATLVSSLFRD